MYEYKVLTYRDARFSGKFDHDTLETTVNSLAREGWRVINGFTASSVWKTVRTEIVVILERDGTPALPG